MASISCRDAAGRLLAQCLSGEPWSAGLLGQLLSEECSEWLFRVVAEGLSDRFEPALCDVYAAIFSEAIASALPEWKAAELEARYRRVRTPRPFQGDARKVVVLSRVTLGADVAVTSVFLDAVKRRFPHAAVWLAGGAKSAELFAGDPRIRHLPVAYPRGTLRERLSVSGELREALAGALVIDPDSRLTQLGLLPVCPEDRYIFFESRAYGGAGEASLPELAARFTAEVFGVEGARPYVALRQPAPPQKPVVSVSFGVGENPAKRLPDPFERDLLAGIGAPIWIDKGAGGEEAGRAERAARGLPDVRFCTGSFAEFAAVIAHSRLYVGYDSAGQHVAAACGVPLVSIFAGFPNRRMFHRWRPKGDVILVEEPEPAKVLPRALEKIHDRLQDRK